MKQWLEEFEGRKILIWGFGLEGRSTYRFIRRLLPEQEVTIAESRKRGSEGLQKLKDECTHVQVIFEDEIIPENYDVIMKSPGIVLPEGFPLSNVSGQAPLFLKHYRRQTVGITGTKGKSTTTSLMQAVLSQKYPAHLVGNIGYPCFDVIEDMENGDMAAFEISCHQLEYSSYSPYIAVYLNLFEEHLDHYGSFAKYGQAKDQIFLHQEDGDLLVIGEAIAERAAGHANTVILGREVRAKGRTLYDGDRILEINDCALIGDHNYMNMAAVYHIAGVLGISDEEFLRAVGEFRPLHHRLEDIGEKDGIRFVNDSISTIGPSCIQALKALPETGSVLIGGMDRGIDYSDLEEYLLTRRDLEVIFMYATGRRVLDELKAKTDISGYHFRCAEDLQEAVKLAKQVTPKGKICLLSPAASSYDHFKNFEERGEIFGKLALGS